MTVPKGYEYTPKFWVGSPCCENRTQETSRSHSVSLSRDSQRHARGYAGLAFGESARSEDIQDHRHQSGRGIFNGDNLGRLSRQNARRFSQALENDAAGLLSGGSPSSGANGSG